MDIKIDNFIKNKINESSSYNIRPGYYIVNNTFKLSPGGGWAITFSKGSILNMTKTNQMYSWNALKNDWILRKPPISGVVNLELSTYGGASSMFNEFTQNTSSITEEVAFGMIKIMAKDIVLTVKDAIKMLQDMPSNNNVKITIIE